MTDSYDQDNVFTTEDYEKLSRVEEGRLRQLTIVGVEAEVLLESQLGNYLEARAADEIEQAKSGLIEVHHSDNVKIQALQLQAIVAGKALTWIHQAIADGQNAHSQLDQDEAEMKGYA